MVITSFSCWSKTQQDRLNTRVNFGSAQPSKVDPFSVGANSRTLKLRATEGGWTSNLGQQENEVIMSI